MKIISQLVLFVLLTSTATALAGDFDMQERRRRGPPPEALDACSDKSQGDYCTFEAPHGTVEGTCWAPREDLPLACRPDDPKR